MDDEFVQVLLKNSIKKNALIALEAIKLMSCQAQAIVHMDELRKQKELLDTAQDIITKITPLRGVLENITEGL